jgi:hypothetical protein
MSSRVQVLAAVAVMTTALGCSGSALASSPAPVQVTGTRLESALLPASDFAQHTFTIRKFNSGSRLKDEPTLDHIATMSCTNLLRLFPGPGFGPTAYAGDNVVNIQPPVPDYAQSVYQFARISAATALYTQAAAGYARCRSVTVQVGRSPVLASETVHSVSKVLAGGHQAFAVSMSMTIYKVPGRPHARITATVDLLVAANGVDLFTVSRSCEGSPPATPALPDVIGKLIASVQALG